MASWVKLPDTWVKLTDTWYVCEYGCFNSEGYNEEHCHHSSDSPDDGSDGRMNAAHWKRIEPSDMPHGFLCNYHYEELVLGRTHPTDDEIEAASKVSLPSAEEFELGIGEVK